MKHWAVFVICVASLISTPSLRAQANAAEKDVMEPFTEIGEPDCEFLWAQLDLVRGEMFKNLDAKLVVDITGIADSPTKNFYWYEYLRNYLSRYIPSERWTIRTPPLTDRREVKFWLLQPGEPPPPRDEAKWTYSFPSATKPFLFTNKENYLVEVGVCFYVNEIAMLASALKDNPEARVNIVLIVRTEREFARRKREAVEELADYGTTPNRIRVFKQTSRKPNPYGIQPMSEYWFLP